MAIQILLYVLFFIVGMLMTYTFFKEKMYKSLKKKYDILSEEKTPIDQKTFNNIKKDYDELILKNNKLEKTIDTLKSYLGLVKDNEYGIIKKSLTYGENDSEISVTAEFKTIQRGENKVKISLNIDSIKTSPNESSNKTLMSKIKEFIDDWYDIDCEGITWVIPDKSMEREFNIDEILNQ